jgi:hypothetical protein
MSEYASSSISTRISVSSSRILPPWFWPFLLALVVRLVFLRLTPNNTTDAWSRLMGSEAVLRNPWKLPPLTAHDAWLPLHFWILAAVLKVWNSEIAARLFSVLLGSLTILPLWGIAQLAFGDEIAAVSALTLALFGFHIAFSVSTGSEAPIVFLMATGIYFWLRYLLDRRWKYFVPSTVALVAASLIRFEPWVAIPVMGLLLLDFSGGWNSLWSNRKAWAQVIAFGLSSSSGAIFWMAFSFWKWGDPMKLPHRTIVITGQQFRLHGLVFRILDVPASLAISLSPALLLLAIPGILLIFRKGPATRLAVAIVMLTLFGFNFYTCIHYQKTQARFTILYSWLLIPFAFGGLEWIAKEKNCTLAVKRQAIAGILAFFLVWQAGIALGAEYGPPGIADHLGGISPLQPLHVELRSLTAWLKNHVTPPDTVAFDEFNFESDSIIRFSNLGFARAFQVRGKQEMQDQAVLREKLQEFWKRERPRFLVCSPYGPIGRLLAIDDKQTVKVPWLGVTMTLGWMGPHWRVYEVRYE